MKLGLLADIHGNEIALQTCTEKISWMSLDEIYFLGDAIGYMPDESNVLAWLQSQHVQCQRGNHEMMFLSSAAQPPVREQLLRLSDVRLRLPSTAVNYISGWPEQRQLLIDEQAILLVHGSPDNPGYGYVYPDTDLSLYSRLPYDVVFMANTHRPFIRHHDDKLFVNVGSIGLPRDQGNLASFAVYDTSNQVCRILRIELDINRILTAYRDAVDPAVCRCFLRKSTQIAGEII